MKELLKHKEYKMIMGKHIMNKEKMSKKLKINM